MTPDELKNTYDELSLLTAELQTASNAAGENQMQRVVAGLGLILAKMSRMVVETKEQCDEIAYRERERDKGQVALRDERAAKFFADLSPGDRERLVQAVESGAPNISTKDFADTIARNVGMYSWRVNELLQWVAQWYDYLAQREGEDPVNEVAKYLVENYSFDQDTRNILKSVDVTNPSSTFMQQLKRLLRCRSTLGISNKAEVLVRRNERQYMNATVSTDLRPIFSSNVEAIPTYGVVVHNLILFLNDGGNSRSVGLSLTSSDILAMGEVLNRAYKKEVTLRKQAPYKILPIG